MVGSQEGARLDSPRAFMNGASGRWAGERFMEAIRNNREISPADLRTLDTLRRDEWIEFDNALVQQAQIRLRGVSALIAAGLVRRIANGLAKTVLMYDKMTDMNDAVVSMDGVARSENDTVEFEEAGIPLPITHKDWHLNLRRLMASRLRGEPLDLTHIRAAGRKIGEETERMLFQGGKTFGGLTIYGLTTHPNRNTASFGDGGTPWGDSSKTGAEILADIGTLMAASEADRAYGPWWLFLSSDASLKLGEDFKANSDRTIRERILALDGINQIIVADQMPANTVVLVQATSDVIEMIEGEPLQTVQWDVKGGFQIEFKGFQIMVPLIKADSEGRSGIVHMS